MSDREFDRATRTVDGKPSTVFVITCAACGATEECVQASFRGLAPAVVERSFSNRGWQVGKNPRKDRCPACQARKPKPEVQPIMAEITKAETPRTMTREDRRVIFEKLNEVYVDETSGYSTGWTDIRVATDLGVPRAWVEHIRDENFGPARDNPDIRDFLTKLDAISTEGAEILAKTELALAAANALAVRLKELETLAKRVRQQTGN